MAKIISAQTRLKRGDIVRVFGRVLGVVVRHEKFLGRSGFYAFNSSTGDKKFIKEHGVDWYTRRRIKDLAHDKAEVITRNELLAMYNEMPSHELEILLEMTKHRKRSK